MFSSTVFHIILFYSKVFHGHMVKVIQYKLTPEKKKSKNGNQRLLPRIVGKSTASLIGLNVIIIIIIVIIT